MAVLIIYFPVTSALHDGLTRTPSGFSDLALVMNSKPMRFLFLIRLVKIQNISTKEEVETAKMEPKCGELEDLSEYMKKTFYHDMLDKIF